MKHVARKDRFISTPGRLTDLLINGKKREIDFCAYLAIRIINRYILPIAGIISDAIEKCSIFRFFLYASICRKRKGAYGFSAAELFDHPVGFDGVRTWIAWKELRQTGFRNAIFTALDRVVN